MQKNKRNIGDVVFKPSALDPLYVSKCLIVGITLTDHALAQNYNSGKKLNEYNWGDRYQIEYLVMEEGREGIRHIRYTEESLYETREAAMEYIYNKAKEVLDSTSQNDSDNNNK